VQFAELLFGCVGESQALAVYFGSSGLMNTPDVFMVLLQVSLFAFLRREHGVLISVCLFVSHRMWLR
jgi:hypothetical protein